MDLTFKTYVRGDLLISSLGCLQSDNYIYLMYCLNLK